MFYILIYFLKIIHNIYLKRDYVSFLYPHETSFISLSLNLSLGIIYQYTNT